MWYHFRFRYPARLELDEKRQNTHHVAGITENDTYCDHSKSGDRALSLEFAPFNKQGCDSAQYDFCTYNKATGDNNACKGVNFSQYSVEGKWIYIYNSFSSEEGKVYAAMVGDDSFKAITIPGVKHRMPANKLTF